MHFHLKVNKAKDGVIGLEVIIDDKVRGKLFMPVNEYEKLGRLLLLGGLKWGSGVGIQVDGYKMEDTNEE